mgnify:CR=1 FL=1|tara:strand:- start:882 stop:2237 length:1356 start_codon:yes stop_codon:yes gene_type:complete
MVRLDEIQKLVVKNGVKYLTLSIVDINGVLRGKRLPVDQLEKIIKEGARMPFSAANVDIWGRDIDGSPLLFESGDRDGRCIWTARKPIVMNWIEPHDILIPMSYFNEDGSPFLGDSRNLLIDVLHKYTAEKLTPVVGIELEFYLTNLKALDDALTNPLNGAEKVHDGVLSIDDIYDYSKFLDEICNWCEINDIALEALSSESGRGQFELCLKHTEDVLKLADGLIFLKNSIRFISKKNGFAATFMAKPFPNRPGNGLHAHFSLLDENKNNVFDNGTLKGSYEMLSSVGGLLTHLRQSTLIFAPHLNSFRRLSPNQHAPINLTWGYENRTAAIRIPGGKQSNRRIEHRVSGADTNIYLVLATILGAAFDGLRNCTEAPQPVSGDCSGEYIQQATALPTTWFEAISFFESGDLIGGTINSVIHDMMIRTKKQELLTFTRDISSFEYKSYLEVV